MVFGTFINKSTIEYVANFGMMLYQKRRIIERLNDINNEIEIKDSDSK